MSRLKDRLIVVGAGVSGLCAAAALAGYFREVVIYERDALPDQPSARKGVPQSHQLHGLLSGGSRALAQLFPKLDEDLLALGAVRVDFFNDYLLEVSEKPWVQQPSALIGYSMSRPLIEYVVRSRVVSDIPNIVWRHRKVERLVYDDAGQRVSGVDESGEYGERVLGDLVIDASGRPLLGQQLLASLSRNPVSQSEVEFNLSYATGSFANVHLPDGSRALMTYPIQPNETLSGILTPMEGGLHKATIVTHGGSSTPETEQEFKDRLKQLRTDTMARALEHASLRSEISRFNFPSSVWVHWEKYNSHPADYIAVGDAYCRFNPVYGQGMSIAAIEGVLLRDLVKQRRIDQVVESFYEQIQPVIAAVWNTAVISHDRSTLSEEDAAASHYIRALFGLASTQPAVAQTLLEVIHLLKTGDALSTPEMQAAVAGEQKRMPPAGATA